jgi:hypothetical protein
VRFTNYLGIDSLGRLSVTLKKFPRIEKEMIKMAKLATQEQRAIMKAEKITGKKQAKPRKKFTRNNEV